VGDGPERVVMKRLLDDRAAAGDRSNPTKEPHLGGGAGIVAVTKSVWTEPERVKLTGPAPKFSAQADVRREQVIATAAELFDQHGYHNTSMNDVAQAVRLAKPSLYHYFPKGKAEILFLIHEQFLAALVGAYAARKNETLPPSERLHGMMTDMVGVMDTHRSHVRVFFEYYRELPSEQLTVVQGNARRYRALMEEILSDGVDSGEFVETDVRAATLAIFGMCNWVYQWYRGDDRLSPEEIADCFFSLVTKGLFRPAPAKKSRVTRGRRSAGG
jgi:AcrR family transcriptional regulator